MPDSIHRLPGGGYIVHFIGTDQQLSEIVRYDSDLRVHSVIGFDTRDPELEPLRRDDEFVIGFTFWLMMLLASACIGYIWWSLNH